MNQWQKVYEDKWGAIICLPGGCLEISWYQATETMTGTEFNAFLSRFAGLIVDNGCQHALVDATCFKMDPAKMEMGWRDEHIIPQYNAAGLKKFAFVMSPGMPAIGNAPAVEGPADFPTAYLGSRADALGWLGC